MAEKVFLLAEDISFRYFAQQKQSVIEHASITIMAGSTTVITGVSGCGKSTLAAIWAGLYPENGGELISGKVTLNGQPLNTLTPSARSQILGMMLQNPELSFCMDTLRKEMIFCLENRQIKPADMDQEITEYSESMGVNDLLDRKLSTLSGGEKQKAALCCLLLSRPAGIILDEPFANLDQETAKALLGLLRQEQRRRELTIIAIDHRLQHWEDMAAEVIVLGGHGVVKERRPMAKAKTDISAQESAISLSGREAVVALEKVTVAPEKGGKAILCDIDLTIRQGGIYALLGASGAGKTTLFLTLLGQLPYQGKIRASLRNGGTKELRKLSEQKWFRETGIVFQNPAHQFITTKVIEEVLISLRIWQPSLDEIQRETYAKELLREYGLLPFRNYSPYMLSQGQQRRLAVLVMIAGGQRLLLLDEPTYGQDDAQVKVIMDMIKDKSRQEGLTILFTTHDRGLAAAYADQIYEIQEGRLMAWND